MKKALLAVVLSWICAVAPVQAFFSAFGSSNAVKDAIERGQREGKLPSAKAPSGLQAVRISDTAARLFWQDHSDNETGFRIERKSGGDFFQPIGTTGAGVNYFTDTGLVGGQAYIYRVRALTAQGMSDYSSEAQVSSQREITATPAFSASVTPTPWSAALFTRTATITWAATATRSATRTMSGTPGVTASVTRTRTPATTRTGTPVDTALPTATPTETREDIFTLTATPTSTVTGTATPSVTLTGTQTTISTATPTLSPSASDTATPTGSDEDTPTRIPSETATPTLGMTGTATLSETTTVSATETPEPIWTETPTVSPSETGTPTETVTETEMKKPKKTGFLGRCPCFLVRFA